MMSPRVRVIVDLEPCSFRKEAEQLQHRDRIQFLEDLLRDANEESARAAFNLTFLQHQYERAMRDARDEAARHLAEKLALQSQVQAQKWREEKLTGRLRDLEEANRRLQVKVERKKSSIVRIALADETSPKLSGLVVYCQECGSNPKNTLNVPCGHMTSCNICVENRRMDIGRSLRFMLSDEKFCLVCKAEIKKVVMAYVF